MSSSARVDFRAEATLSTQASDELVSTRVLMNDDQIVFVTDETKERVALADVFDVSQDVPASADPDTTATITLGFNRGESRETARIECRAETLVKFQLALYKLALGDATVTLKQSGSGSSVATEGETATLEIVSDGVCFDCDEGKLSLSRSDIEGFETTRTTTSGQPTQPTVVLYAHRNGEPVRTTVCLPSFRYLNLFGRYLQSSPRAGLEESPDRVSSQATVLLVDDDPGDLEMTELMLKKREDRVQFRTATSAAGGIENLSNDPVDCIVSDYDMPGTDGVELLQKVREKRPELPFILFTGQGSDAVAKQALLSDVTDYVEKGMGTKQYDILVARIRKALR